MSRFFRPVPAGDLNTAQSRLLEELFAGDRREQGGPVAGSSAVSLAGPFEALMRTPKIGLDLARIGGRLRHQAALPAVTRELLVCLVAAYSQSQFEWAAHAPQAQSLGVSEHDLESITRGVEPTTLSAFDRMAFRLARDLLESQALTDARRNDAIDVLGEAVVVEIAVLVGYYQLIGHVLEISGRNDNPT